MSLVLDFEKKTSIVFFNILKKMFSYNFNKNKNNNLYFSNTTRYTSGCFHILITVTI